VLAQKIQHSDFIAINLRGRHGIGCRHQGLIIQQKRKDKLERAMMHSQELHLCVRVKQVRVYKNDTFKANIAKDRKTALEKFTDLKMKDRRLN
jgi:hypothetical protein